MIGQVPAGTSRPQERVRPAFDRQPDGWTRWKLHRVAWLGATARAHAGLNRRPCKFGRRLLLTTNAPNGARCPRRRPTAPTPGHRGPQGAAN